MLEEVEELLDEVEVVDLQTMIACTLKYITCNSHYFTPGRSSDYSSNDIPRFHLSGTAAVLSRCRKTRPGSSLPLLMKQHEKSTEFRFYFGRCLSDIWGSIFQGIIVLPSGISLTCPLLFFSIGASLLFALPDFYFVDLLISFCPTAEHL